MLDEGLARLLDSLLNLPHELEWVEFKHNNEDPEEMGEYISALSNAASLHKEDYGYLVWGIEDGSKRVVGTRFQPRSAKIGNQELESWLALHLYPRIDFRIHEFEARGADIVLFRIPACPYQPVRWKDTEFIRIGSYKKKLRDFPEKARQLWTRFLETDFEKDAAGRDLSAAEVLTVIDYPGYFELSGQNLPDNRQAILERLQQEKIVQRKDHERFDVTNLGALLFAKRLTDFERLGRKCVRVIIYKGSNRVNAIKEFISDKGYAVGFESLIAYINDQLPRNEQMGPALRKEIRMYPEISIRELVANAIIHQDLTATGDSPLVEVFDDRIEITNAGRPLIDTLRFIDEPPQSRNERLASIMRRLNICEERGSGIDKVVSYAEVYQLPPPDFLVTQNHTKAVMFAYKRLADMDSEEKIRACYQHACLLLVSNTYMTNTSLRKRFSIDDRNYSVASRIIADTIRAGLVKPYDPESSSRKHAKYVPFWA